MTPRRPALLFAGLAAGLAAAMVVALRLGAVNLDTSTIIAALRGNGDPSTTAIVRNLRLPRVIQSALVGAALSLSGAVFQALLQNPLADPYVLGVSSGAAVGAVLVVVLGLTHLGFWTLPVATFVGSLVAIGAVVRIATQRDGTLDGRMLVLAGVIVGALGNSIILIVLTFADAETFRSALFWMMGSNAGATPGGVLLLLVVTGLGLLAFVAFSRPLNLFSIGDHTAATLGVSVRATKMWAFLAASLLAAISVSVSGMIGFVGLVIPHMVRLLWGHDHRILLPASALVGATFLCLADAAARTIAAPSELPIGAVTALIGVPFFLWLLRRRPA